MIFRHIVFSRPILLWLSLVVFMSLTNPNSMPVAFLVFPFVVFGFAVYTTWQAFVRIYARGRDKKVRPERAALLGAVISIVLVFSLGLESLGELTPRDFFVIVLFGAVVYFYMVRSLKQD
ncbi:hypothetical protein CSA80_04105 [Candidatus Saccharibacteria bacterium]|nr:MAG: hypothetical protein CR973_01820 [Candidatus Saccharibacteria bacterium]PID98859.1 MAG: hypothetical protein CSA80_04105 [Candidatus Saccharibacteria bacterium]